MSKPIEIEPTPKGQMTTPCDNKCGDNARFIVKSRYVNSAFLCPGCLLKFQAEILAAFRAYYKASY